MTLVSESRKTVIFLAEKCASTSIREAFVGHEDWERVQGVLFQKSEWDLYQRLGISRNPYSRMVSYWKYWKAIEKLYEQFDDFVVNATLHGYLAPHSLSLTNWYKDIDITHFFRFEQLQGDFDAFGFGVTLPFLNVQDSEPAFSFYKSKVVCDIVTEWAEHDFLRFGYSKMEIKDEEVEPEKLFKLFEDMAPGQMVLETNEINTNLIAKLQTFNILAIELFKLLVGGWVKISGIGGLAVVKNLHVIADHVTSAIALANAIEMGLRKYHEDEDYESFFNHIQKVKQKVYDGMEASGVIDMDHLAGVYLDQKVKGVMDDDEEYEHVEDGLDPCQCADCKEARGEIDPDSDFGVAD